MRKIGIALNGLSPAKGKMAKLLGQAVQASERFEIFPCALTGPEVQDLAEVDIGGQQVSLVRPSERYEFAQGQTCR